MVTGIRHSLTKSLVVGCLVLSGCAMKPQALREGLDECEQYGFDAMVYSRERDGAVLRVLCVPKEDETAGQIKTPDLMHRLRRWLRRPTGQDPSRALPPYSG